MALSQNERGKKEERTLDNLRQDNLNFELAGSILSKAKHYHNAIRPPLINVPLDQVLLYLYIFFQLRKCVKNILFNSLKVCLPGLHISIGIFERLYILFVESRHALEGSEGFQQFISRLQDAQKKRVELINVEQEARQCEQLATYFSLHDNKKEIADALIMKASQLRKRENKLVILNTNY